MKAIFAAVAVSACLLLAVLGGVLPSSSPPADPGADVQRSSLQCPANSKLEGNQCTCPEATSWTGAQCMQVWSSSGRAMAAVAPPQPAR
ncbi:hypothetical protein LXA47_07105 [Massilia sp. P8910]|uniref:hypothetical protein n=1 Tax=Massilia antarctica TaxID=2765360 RepID=UPI0006BB69D2|nr:MULTISPECIES: hypothetical protein [Massilia]MCE3603376.1 hypothetical protein [Massilia antarctica]MCY0912986.1 hypothetical protein [Massilia sp. H27-R4]